MTVSVGVIPSSEVGLIDKDASRGVLPFASDDMAVPFDVVVTGPNERTRVRADENKRVSSWIHDAYYLARVRVISIRLLVQLLPSLSRETRSRGQEFVRRT